MRFFCVKLASIENFVYLCIINNELITFKKNKMTNSEILNLAKSLTNKNVSISTLGSDQNLTVNGGTLVIDSNDSEFIKNEVEFFISIFA